MTYKTKQSAAIGEYINQFRGKYFTAADVENYFREKGSPIGTATVYRHLEAACGEGLIRKYVIDGEKSACYGATDDLGAALLLCEDCGALVSFDCPDLYELYDHFKSEHNIKIRSQKTVFYGQCEKCGQKENKK